MPKNVRRSPQGKIDREGDGVSGYLVSPDISGEITTNMGRCLNVLAQGLSLVTEVSARGDLTLWSVNVQRSPVVGLVLKPLSSLRY
jgi:hypothetical protein